MKKIVVIGFLGTQLDAGISSARWERWRPTIDMTRHEELVISRLVLLYDRHYQKLLQLVHADIAAISPETEVIPYQVNIHDPWDFGEVYAALFDFSRSYPFTPEQEEYWVHLTTGTHVAQICWFLMVETRYIPGILLQTAPPSRANIGKPGKYTLIDLDLSQYDSIAQRFAHAHNEAITLLKSGISTGNSTFNLLINEVEQVAVRSKAPMLLMGPTGAGKSFLAKRIYDLKKARHQITGAFVEINCATLRGEGAASTLFGHVKGAFTGALHERAGLLRCAENGLLFLDEIGELGLDEQAMLLRAIEEKRFYPVGSDQEVSSNFQLMAGTHRDLRAEVDNGKFREDLLARINLWMYHLPSLAQRREDIEPNLDYLLTQQSIELGHNISFNKEARQLYLEYATSSKAHWRGNFRDLVASITRLATLAEGGRIGISQVNHEIERLASAWQTPPATQANAQDNSLTSEQWAELDLFERLQLQAVIRVCQDCSSLSDAGRSLFAISRTQRSVANDADRLRKYLAKFGLTWANIQVKPPSF